MPAPINLMPGQQFGRLTILSADVLHGPGKSYVCKCSCGTVKSVLQRTLRPGRSKSCGCLQRDVAAELKKTHGKWNTPEFNSWTAMISRCYSPKNIGFRNYGGRGITVCDRWRESVAAFIEDMGPRPSPRHSLDRINNDLGYFKENCRWADRITQNYNRRNNARMIFRGMEMTIREAYELTNKEVRYHTFYERAKHGRDPFGPLKTHKNHKYANNGAQQ